MKKLLFFLTLICAFVTSEAQVTIPRREIPYDVNYRWGLIDVMIARGVVSIESDGNSFYGTLDGTSIPWEGKIICVSDTLRAGVSQYGDRLNENVEFQSGWYRHVPAGLFRSGSYRADDPLYYRNIAGGGQYDASHDSMEAITVTSDMIGMYYYAHIINFDGLNPGENIRVYIDGPYSKELVITYNGKGTYNAGGSTYRTYDCTFEYSYGNGMSGYPVECKIGAADRDILFLSASLPVGRVEMLYNPY